jgi:phosphoglycolate phosphatase
MPTALFDIDGTLLNTGGAGRRAMHRAASKLFGVSEFPAVEFSGRTDFAIFHDLLAGLRLEPRDHYAVFRRHYHAELESELESRRDAGSSLLPGVLRLLLELSASADWELGLVTGNSERGARLKLRHSEIDHFFRSGGFGDWLDCRTMVAANAVEAMRKAGLGCDPATTVVIGDTLHDIQCARGNGMKVLAVATGWSSMSELAQAFPDLLVESLQDMSVGKLTAMLVQNPVH